MKLLPQKRTNKNKGRLSISNERRLARVVARQRREIELLKKQIELYKALKDTQVNNKPEDLITLKDIPKEEGRRNIIEYIKKNPGCMTSEIIEDLKINPSIVLDVLNDLEKENLVSNTQ